MTQTHAALLHTSLKLISAFRASNSFEHRYNYSCTLWLRIPPAFHIAGATLRERLTWFWWFAETVCKCAQCQHTAMSNTVETIVPGQICPPQCISAKYYSSAWVLIHSTEKCA
jgi:hypothetical protein